MCGWVALFNKDHEPVDPSVLASMAEALAHRGPDGSGILIEGAAGLAHKRLAVIDLAGGAQPMTVGPVTVVHNGEIFNYRELRRELEGRGIIFRTNSDTEVLARAYLAWGEDCVLRFNGMFAFVVFDRRNGRVFAARDPFGIKPLYIWTDGRRTALASEIKAFLRHPAFRPEPEPAALRDYAVFQYVLGEETFFRGVRKIRPGHSLSLDPETGTEKHVRYWEPDFEVRDTCREEHCVEILRDLLRDAVRLQLQSDVPVGATLSGGIDSSLVTILAGQLGGGSLTAFTGAFREGPAFDESEYARQAAAAAGAELRLIHPTAADFIEVMPKIVYHMDEPAAGPGVFAQYVVAREASRSVKVLLGGQGGDEVFGGYVRYVIAYLEQALKGAVYQSNDEGEHIVSLSSILPNLPALRTYGPMLRYFYAEGFFGEMDRRYFRLIDRSQGDLGCFAADMRAGLDPEVAFGRFHSLFHHPRTLSYFNKMVHFDLAAGLPSLLHVEDRVSAAHGLESRVPLLDRRIVEFVASLPPRLKYRGAEMKVLLKKAAAGIVPSSILARRDKMGFPVPLHLWARNGLGAFFRDVLTSQACRERGLFDQARVAELIGREEDFGRRLWGLLNIELWFRTFIDGSGRSGGKP
ncbi:MAG: asparagine synthase (glutamine-hydrolyzing) [Acidobacteriota bacterium]|nr:asparagine synthase (glutamine-hydrolyzing) [Acidobacteriota bacterium]